MDRPPPDNRNLPEPVPRPRAHRREHRLHDVHRRHGALRYEPYANDRENRQRVNGRHAQYYQWHWETENNRWIWLRPNAENTTRARCIACHVSLGADIGTIRTHETSRAHRHTMENFNVPMDDIYDHHLNREEFDDETATIKILLAAYFASEGIAYRKIDSLLPLIKRICRHPGVLKEVKLTRWDLSKINTQVIAPVFKQHLAERLSRTKFSILFDESTGINKDKHGCLLVRFADDRSYTIRTVLWDLIRIYREDEEHSDETAESLNYLITNSLFGRQLANEENRVALPRENLVASGSDGCNTMVGVNNSVATRLMTNFPGINHITCPCHGAALCGSHSIEECPVIIQILVDIYNWLCSAKRLYALYQNQIRLNMDVHKILRFVAARWLTALPALIRIDEQMPAIDATLTEYPLNPQALELLMLIRSPLIQCLIPFFMIIWEVVEDFNGWMQTEEVIFPEVFTRMTADFQDILLCYMEAEHVQNANLLEFDTEDADHFLPDDHMLRMIGNGVQELAQELPQEQYAELVRVIRQYLIHLAHEWLERLVLPWVRYRCTESLLPENALSAEYRLRNPEAIPDLIAQFPRAVPANANEEVLQNQWNQLTRLNQLNWPLPRDRLKTDYFWFIIKNLIDEQGENPYRALGEFVLNILCTPHSNAQPERIWSIEKYIKNKYRNLLALASVRAMFLVKECLKLHDCDKEVHKFVPSREMIRRVRRRLFINVPDYNLNDVSDASESETDGEDDQ